MSAELLGRILEAARVGEDSDWEFKSEKGGFPGSFCETYSAFANTAQYRQRLRSSKGEHARLSLENKELMV